MDISIQINTYLTAYFQFEFINSPELSRLIFKDEANTRSITKKWVWMRPATRKKWLWMRPDTCAKGYFLDFKEYFFEKYLL